MQETDPIIKTHEFCNQHREQLMQSDQCGCFYCLTIFSPSEITEWIDKRGGVANTALCPRCKIDSVIGSQSGYPITNEFLQRMYDHWFA